MRVVVVSGIWPPDPGGPASHAPALADFLAARGHAVEVVTTADAQPGRARIRFSGRRGARAAPRPGRLLVREACAPRGRRLRDEHDPARRDRRRLARRPLVVKLVSDEVFERAAREGGTSGTLDAFQGETGGARTRFLRATRDRRCAARGTSSPRARTSARSRSAGGSSPSVCRCCRTRRPGPHFRRASTARGARAPRRHPRLRRAAGAAEGGRVLLEALAAVPDVTLVVAGDGPERAALEHERRELGLDGRVSFLGERAARARAPALRAPPTRQCCSPPGRTSRTRSSRRSRSAAPSSRRPLAVFRRWCATGRTACSSRRAIRRRSAAAIATLLRRRRACGALADARRSVEGYAETAVFERIEAELVRAATA